MKEQWKLKVEADYIEYLRHKSLARLYSISFAMEALLANELEKELNAYFAKANFNPNQPRVPRGSPEGGQWATEEGGSLNLPSSRVLRPNTRNTLPRISSIRGPHGEGANRANIFIGGALDSTLNHNVLNSPALRKDTYGDNYYATHDQKDKIIEQIEALQKNQTVNLIGHSWGGDTAAEVAVALPGRINILITVDPVSEFPPDFHKIRASVNFWIDIYAAGNPETSSFEGMLRGNLAALAGGRWKSGPENIANMFIFAPYDHAEFTNIIKYISKNRKLPQSVLSMFYHGS